MHSQKNPARRIFLEFFSARGFVFALGLFATNQDASSMHARPAARVAPPSVGAASVQIKRDSMTITLEPMARTEVKLVMKKAQKAAFAWKSDGAEVTYNLHGEGPDAPGGKAHTYKRGQSNAETGNIVALFDGIHGWSWRNTSEKPVKITVTAWGQFSELKKM